MELKEINYIQNNRDSFFYMNIEKFPFVYGFAINEKDKDRFNEIIAEGREKHKEDIEMLKQKQYSMCK